jgi:hypothetical protein
MAAVSVHPAVSSPKNCKSYGVNCNSDCECCSFMKSDVQALVNDVNSMTEIINFLRDEWKYNSALDIGAWNKTCTTVSDAGFRDGAAAGRDAVFQKDFDMGYAEGYQAASSLGYLNGTITKQRKLNGHWSEEEYV